MSENKETHKWSVPLPKGLAPLKEPLKKFPHNGETQVNFYLNEDGEVVYGIVSDSQRAIFSHERGFLTPVDLPDVTIGRMVYGQQLSGNFILRTEKERLTWVKICGRKLTSCTETLRKALAALARLFYLSWWRS